MKKITMPIPKRELVRPTRCLPALFVILALSGCASQSTPSAIKLQTDIGQGVSAASNVQAVLRALQRGDSAVAQELAQRLVLADPRNGRSHLLLAAAYQLSTDAAAIELAASGYGAARQMAGDDLWANYLAGTVAMQMNKPRLALEYFAAAVMMQPDHVWATEGVAAAAYASGDIGLAEAAAMRVRVLQPLSIPAWRVATLSRAAAGDRAGMKRLLALAPSDVPTKLAQFIETRADNLIRTAAVDQSTAGNEPKAAPSDAASKIAAVSNNNQMTVDVTLILADDRMSSANGINLLDGLQLQFGGDRKVTVSRSSTTPETFQSALTRSIRLPDITYNLNIFNRGARYYEVMARPTLTAFNGQQSTFFVGEQLFVQVSGVNTAQLEKIDVGVSVKLTPSEITAEGAKFKIEADRSFFSDQGVGSFKEQLATFKQSVSATAEVKFGETLLLSGLSEKLRDGNSSRTPVLGDIPGTNALFKRSTLVERSRSVLVLVTPSQPLGIARATKRGDAAERLIEFWDRVIEPAHGGAPLIKRLESKRLFTRPAAGDVALRDLRDREVLDALIVAFQAREEA